MQENRRIEYARRSSQALEGLCSLAEASGLPLARIAELAAENRLGELFDIETRKLAYRHGRRIPTSELRGITQPVKSVAAARARLLAMKHPRSDEL